MDRSAKAPTQGFSLGVVMGSRLGEMSANVRNESGEFDAVIMMYRQAFDSLEENMPGLRKKVLVPGAGHWIQQERPIEVNVCSSSF
jgi:hypothetical protein